MYFRFGSALVLVVLISLGGIALEKRTLELRRSVTRQPIPPVMSYTTRTFACVSILKNWEHPPKQSMPLNVPGLEAPTARSRTAYGNKAQSKPTSNPTDIPDWRAEMNESNRCNSSWRPRLIIVLLTLSTIALGMRLVQLQWVDRSQFAKRANRQRTFIEPIVARPGDIVDRDGRLLATTIAVRSLYAVPSQIDDHAEFSRRISPIIDVEIDQLTKRLQSHKKKQFPLDQAEDV